MTLPRDDLGRAVDALMDAIEGDGARIRATLGDLLAVVFGRLTSTIGAVVSPLDKRQTEILRELKQIRAELSDLNSRLGATNMLAHEIHRRLDIRVEQIDDQEARIALLERERGG